jgi:hypothetical protein
MANSKVDLSALVSQVKKSNVDTPVQKVVPVQKPVATGEKGFYVKIPNEMIVFLKNKASLVDGLSVKELINDALLTVYKEEYDEFVKRHYGKNK